MLPVLEFIQCTWYLRKIDETKGSQLQYVNCCTLFIPTITFLRVRKLERYNKLHNSNSGMKLGVPRSCPKSICAMEP
jgi:hypothetical protein